MSVEDEIADELDRAIKLFPTWPRDPFHALAILGEEFGELTKAVVELTYEPHKASIEDVRKEMIQTAATAIRWAMKFDTYEFAKDGNHLGGRATYSAKTAGMAA